jgi:membrane fusion protein (multidrug efflux system)
MARTIETEVVETMPSEVIGKHDSSVQEGTERQQLKGNAPSRKRSRLVLLFAAVLAVAAATSWWLNSRNYESTDDAQIEGHLDLVSPRISGTVSYINPRVENNQFVEAGTLLLELDPRDYEAEF